MIFYFVCFPNTTSGLFSLSITEVLMLVDSTATKTKTRNLGVVVGSVVGGLLLLLLIAGVVVFSVWYRRKKAHDSKYFFATLMDFSDWVTHNRGTKWSH